ncbi:MAG: hypothetical protein ACTHMC_01645 [Pseudobacter sp.]|uniref:hypothetical protein n=1 Tax=Pseudobacter sp. TaxID=2045420 RepID=UPI003F7EEC41
MSEIDEIKRKVDLIYELLVAFPGKVGLGISGIPPRPKSATKEEIQRALIKAWNTMYPHIPPK